MNRLLRWQTFVPQLLLVVVTVLAAQYALGLAARRLAVSRLESAVGALVEIEHARVFLTDRQLVLGGVRFANPRRPAELLVEADRCELDFAAGLLSRRRAIIDRGLVTGLRVPRAIAKSSPAGNWFNDNSADLAGAWLARLDERFEPELAGRFESIQRCDSLCTRVDEQCAALFERAQKLQRRAAGLQQASDAAQANLLRHAHYLQGLHSKLEALRRESESLRADIEKLPAALEADRRAIVAARRQDEQLVREHVRLEPIDAKALTGYLLHKPVADALDELIGRLRWARQFVPAASQPTPRPQRGKDVVFADCRAAPNFLIRALWLQGEINVARKPLELRGTLTNVTSTPSLHAEPMRLRLVTSGRLPLKLDATIDRTGAVARDELIVHCRQVAMPELRLGRCDQLQMTVAPSTASLSVSVNVVGEKLSGNIQLAHQQVRMACERRGDSSDLQFAAPLAAAIDELNSLTTHLSLQGTLTDPSCTLSSNLGPAVAEAIERTLRKASDDHAQAMLANARRQVDERLADLERRLANEQTKLHSVVTNVSGQLDSLVAEHRQVPRVSVERIGKRLPKNAALR